MKRLIAQKNVLKNKQIKEISEEISRQFKFVKNRLNNEIRKSKRLFYDTKLAKCSSAGGRFKVFNEFCGSLKQQEIAIRPDNLNLLRLKKTNLSQLSSTYK